MIDHYITAFYIDVYYILYDTAYLYDIAFFVYALNTWRLFLCDVIISMVFISY